LQSIAPSLEFQAAASLDDLTPDLRMHPQPQVERNVSKGLQTLERVRFSRSKIFGRNYDNSGICPLPRHDGNFLLTLYDAGGVGGTCVAAVPSTDAVA